jgi:predicted naringenin-chalcone synthase
MTPHNPFLRSCILAIGRATPDYRVTQEESFRLSRYDSEGARRIFLTSGIDSRHFYFDEEPRFDETSDELNARYQRGALQIGCRAVRTCLDLAGLSPRDVDLLVVCSSTGYVCPDLGTRLIGHMGFRPDVRRAPMIGLGCAGAVPGLQRAADFTREHVGLVSLMLAVEICSACYYFDDTLETVVGHAICSDGAAAVLQTCSAIMRDPYPSVVDFESFLDLDHLQTVGFEHREGKLRIILGAEVRNVAPHLIRQALTPLLERHGLSPSDIRFWVAHPGGRKVIDNVQKALELTDAQLRFSRAVLRHYGNMSSPTVLFVLDEVVRNGNPRHGDWGVLIALGPGMAAEVALLQW